MNLINIKDLIPGMCIDRDVRDHNRLVNLLSQGTVLSQSQIDRLMNWKLYSIDIKDTTEKTTEIPIAVHKTKAGYVNTYKETVDQIFRMFTYIKKFKKVPTDELLELVDQKIILLVNTMGALEYLHKMQSYNNHTFYHSLNVSVIAGIIGKWCNCQGTELKNLILSGLLHDIGKLLVPSSILDKSGRLTSDEYNIIKIHPQKGYQMIKDDGQIPKSVKTAVLQHHERLDGSGYPLGLTCNKISSEAKMVSIADVYDAITSNRTYKIKMTPFGALDILKNEIFEKLDPETGLTFIKNMRDYLIGSCVILSNGKKAKIVAFNTNGYFTKPIICLQNGNLVNLQKTDIHIASW